MLPPHNVQNRESLLMRDLKPIGNMLWAVLFCFAATFGFNGCGDVNDVAGTPPSTDANLSSIAVSPGTLQPAFSSDVINYTVDVTSSVTSVTVTAQPQDAGATVSIKGQTTKSRSVTLGAEGSSTPISIVVTAPNGNQKAYTVIVNRAGLAGNTNLQSLTVSPGTLVPAFIATTTGYTVAAASGVGSVTVTAQAQDAGATVSINGQTTTSRSVSLGAAGSSTLITIVVTAPNGNEKTYLVTVNRAALGGNNNLQSLTVSPGTLVPAFAAGTLNYTVAVASGVGSVTVTAQAQDSGATVSIDGQTTTSRSVSLGAAGSSTPIPIEVTPPNGNQKTYTVIVNRAALGGNNNLQSLTVSPGTLAPAFAAGTLNYTVAAASGVGSVTVAAQAQDTGATVSIDGQTTTSLLVTLGAAGSSTPIPIEVTALNGSQKTYTVIVNRAALGGNNNLQSLTVSPGTLAPAFAAGTLNYTVAAASGVGSVTVAAQAQDTGATVSIDGQTTTSLLVTLGAAGSSTPIPIEVTAVNGNQKTYTVIVNRAALGGNNNLQSLTVSPGTLAPAFAAGTLNYTVAAASGVGSVTVAAQAQDTGATVSIDGQTTTSLLVTLGAAGSSTPISIEVTAPNGDQKTYSVTVNRAAIVLSGDNNLSALVVSAGALIETFDAGTLIYTVTAPNTTTDTTITATVADSTATLTINGSPEPSGAPSASIPLVGGTNPPISVVVTAENSATKTYTITITVEP